MKAKLMLPALTEATSPDWQPILGLMDFEIAMW